MRGMAMIADETECRRCGDLYAYVETYCPKCLSCQMCECCPCYQVGCDECKAGGRLEDESVAAYHARVYDIEVREGIRPPMNHDERAKTQPYHAEMQAFVDSHPSGGKTAST
jgi:hypothetical protein